MKAKDVQLNEAVQGLLNQVNAIYPGKVEVQFIGELQARLRTATKPNRCKLVRTLPSKWLT